MSSIAPDKMLFRDPTAPLADRVQDLLARLTLAEKVSQMSNSAAAIPRLGIPAYDFWSEGLHGVARNGRATVFPAPILMAAAWDPDLAQTVATAVADEARAKYHAALARSGATGQYQGLTLWSPNVNIFRDPRWGRGQETWGEDPTLTGALGTAYVRGLQGDDPRYLKTAACAKHYAVHSGPERERHTFNAHPSRRDLYDTYLPAFKQLVQAGGVEAVMGAYNRVNGDPCCASPELLTHILREEWGFTGHVVSDCGALSDIHRTHRVTADAAESAAAALKAGCDMGCDCVFDAIPEAIQRGLIEEADVDRALARTLTTRFRLGMFDPPEQVPYTSIPLSVVDSAGHRALAYRAAVESVVLLKNEGSLLPLDERTRSILLVGPAAASLEVLLGNYYGLNPHMVTLLEGIAGRVNEGTALQYRPGVGFLSENRNPADVSVAETLHADVTIACMGSTPLMEGEEGDAIYTTLNGDRAEIGLPAAQVSYLKRLAAASERLVLVLTGGSPLALGEVADLADAILWVGYPGEEGGRAVADVIFGAAVPGGKLPITFPVALEDLPPFEDYRMEGRTYRYSRVDPLYPFGFGLSYTRFAYPWIHLDRAQLPLGEALTFQAQVTNLGTCAGDEVVQVYLSDLETSAPAPICKLVAFQRVHLEAGAQQQLCFTLTAEQMSFFDAEGRPCLEPGSFRLVVGGCSPGERGRVLGAPQPAQAEFALV